MTREELDWSYSFGGAVIRPKTTAAEKYCQDNGTYFEAVNAYFVEGYGQFDLSGEPVPPKQCEVLLDFAEAPCLGGLSESAKQELCRYWGLLPESGEVAE